VRRSVPWLALAALGGALTGCGGATHVGTPAATPPGPSSTPATTAPEPSASAQGADWTTYHEANTRTGAVSSGPALGRVRPLWSAPVDGAVYAEPLVVGGRVIVATENDSVYAFDAATGARLWGVHLGTPVSGGSLPCGDIDPSGITSTPVADPGTGVLYVVVYKTGFRHFLVALDISSGAVRWQRPIDPPGGDYKTEQQRAALALANGRVYVAYGGLFGDCGTYHGWVVGAPASAPTGALVTYRVPSQNEGAIWAPSGPAVDRAGNVYVATGNGNSSSFDYGNAVIRLAPALKFASFFAPPNAGALNLSDTDLGSTGPLLLPGSRVFIAGKSGVGYLLDADHLAGLGNGLASINLGSAAFGGDAYADGTIYVPTVGGMYALQVQADSLRTLWHQRAASQSPIVAGPGVWAIGNGTLYQLDPGTGAVRYSAAIGQSAHFATPAASGGRVYVAADGRVDGFG
jgi:outer membrane protein assembly factor BamB